jgi:hypothetical protein
MTQPFHPLLPDAICLGFWERTSDPVEQPQLHSDWQVADPPEEPAQAGYLAHWSRILARQVGGTQLPGTQRSAISGKRVPLHNRGLWRGDVLG